MTFSVMAERVRFAPQGLVGGDAARSNHYIRDPEGAATRYPSKFSVDLAAGEVMSIQSGGGGGYGEVALRDPALVRADVAAGRISPARAARRLRRPIERGEPTDAVSGFRVAIDIGGTFTDVVLVDEATGSRWTGKVLTTPDDPSEGFFRALDLALGGGRRRHRRLPVGAPCDDGRDERGDHPDRRPGRAHRHRGVPRRPRDRPPDPPRAVRPADDQTGPARPSASGRSRSASGCRSTAPSSCRSTRSPSVARRRPAARGRDPVGRGLPPARLRQPGPRASGSPRSCATRSPGSRSRSRASIAPEIREYPRASTTVANAYVGPVVGALHRSHRATGCADRGANTGLWLMKSNGGLATAADGARATGRGHRIRAGGRARGGQPLCRPRRQPRRRSRSTWAARPRRSG